jgi:adenylosuccinate synthase
MPISVVVGGQFGSEGKGKVALHIARRERASFVVRVGGTNSGHTGVDNQGRTWALRQLPVSVLAPDTIAILPAGAIIDPEIFHREVQALQLGADRVIVSRHATVISAKDKEAERVEGLVDQIGSTGSGTGAALKRRIGRQRGEPILAGDHPALQKYLGDPSSAMREALNRNRLVVIEGSQGFGLSVLHGGYYPNATSRDTTAATFVGEAGLSPRDVADVTLVLRAHPIRVAGNSGELKGETTWAEIAKAAGLPQDYCELTTATKKIRRVGIFDPQLVRRAMEVNNPTRLVLNHFDYLDRDVGSGIFRDRAIDFLEGIERSIGRTIDWIGTGPAAFTERGDIRLVTETKNAHSSLQQTAPPRRNAASGRASPVRPSRNGGMNRAEKGDRSARRHHQTHPKNAV